MAQNLADRMAISDVAIRYATALDQRNWAALRAILLPRVHIDYSSFAPELNHEMDADDWVAMVEEGLSGFDVTQHISANHVHSIAGDAATCVSYMQAGHFLTDGERQDVCFLYGYYTGDLLRAGDSWLIRKYQLTITAWHGDRTAFGRAVERFRSRR